MTDTDLTVTPQTGPCHVKMWTVIGSTVQDDIRDLGLSRWEDLLELVTTHGGLRLTYDLFEHPNDDGSLTRYRAQDVTL